MQNTPIHDCAIIGAGISGLMAATRLTQANFSVIVLDKGRGVGGRMATRRAGEARIDHGAQFFTQRVPEFAPWIKQWRDDGKIKHWYSNSGDTVWRGSSGMTDVPKLLAEPLDIEKSTRITKVRRENSLWVLTSQNEQEFQAKTILITAPLPQASELLINSAVDLPSTDLKLLASVRYTRCLVALVQLFEPSNLGHPGILKVNNGITETITDNQIKGISPIPALTIHSSPEFAELHWDSEDSIRQPILLKSAKEVLDFKVKDVSMHRWGFAKTLNPIAETHYAYKPLKLAVAGDGFIGGRVEAAAQSGLAAAQSISMMLSQ